MGVVRSGEGTQGACVLLERYSQALWLQEDNGDWGQWRESVLPTLYPAQIPASSPVAANGREPDVGTGAGFSGPALLLGSAGLFLAHLPPPLQTQQTSEDV